MLVVVVPHRVNGEGVFGYEEHIPIFLSQPSYSPDLTPSDFFLFPRIKSDLKQNHFGTIENVQVIVTRTLNSISVEDFQRCYGEWQQHWTRCIESQGDYYENY